MNSETCVSPKNPARSACRLVCRDGSAKLGEEQIMTFSSIADKFLTQLKDEIKYCSSGNVPPTLASTPCFASNPIPQTKGYEESYVPSEHLDMTSFGDSGVIDSVQPRPRLKQDAFLNELRGILTTPEATKWEIVLPKEKYLPNIAHE